MAGQRVDLRTAAELLGISSDAVRKRAKRGTIPYETGVDGKLYVWVDEASPGETDDYPDEPTDRDQGDLVAELRGQVDYLQGIIGTRDRELSEMRRLLAGALERIPEIEAPRDSPPEPRGAPETASEDVGGTETPADDTGEPRRSSWWRRILGFESTPRRRGVATAAKTTGQISDPLNSGAHLDGVEWPRARVDWTP
jgi:hypothetical protein